jgi:hypothetical protein
MQYPKIVNYGLQNRTILTDLLYRITATIIVLVVCVSIVGRRLFKYLRQ